MKDFYLRNDAKEACEYFVNESSKRWLYVYIIYEDGLIDNQLLYSISIKSV